MCGRSNPDDQEVCQFCQARLKPLRISPSGGAEAAGERPAAGGAAPPESAGGSLDWLSSLRASDEAGPSEPAEEALPDWLSGLREQTPLEEEEGAPDDEWLARLAASSAAEPPPAAQDAISWLESYRPSEAEEATPGRVTPGAPDELPDWLAGVEESGVSDEGAEALEWLSSIGPEAESLLGPLGEEKAGEERPEGMPSAEVPALDWLAEIPPAAPEPTESAEEAGWEPAQPEPLPFMPEGEEEAAMPAPLTEGGTAGGDEELDWLKELESAFPETVAETKAETPLPSSAPFTFDEETLAELPPVSEASVPEWLASVAQEAPEEQAEEAAAIEPGTLPSWLEAMRPTSADGSLPPELAEAPVENVGPLAGLRAVLPAEPDILQTRKPPVYSSRLQISDLQAQRAELLAELIKTEGEPRPVPGRPVITPQHILRSLIFLVLLVAIAAPLTLGTPQIARPAAPAETVAVGILIERLPANAPVLLAVDFQPAAAGEMDAVAGAVLDHLMRRGVFLVLVSTSPTGAYQGEYLVQQASLLSGYPHVAGVNYLNLGFIPGGESGLQAFGYAPQQILPLDVGANRVWDHPVLQNVRSAADFAMTLVLTENAETARAWIEQYRPAIGAQPLVMLVSAQVEPYMHPYLEGASGQVQALIAGLAGSAAYEQTWQRVGYASIYWSSYGLAVYAAVLTIVLAGLMNLALIFIKQRQRTASTGGG